MHSLQRIKTSFVFLFWSETKLSIVDGHSTLARFINWVSYK